jgi:hypothetical protein
LVSNRESQLEPCVTLTFAGVTDVEVSIDLQAAREIEFSIHVTVDQALGFFALHFVPPCVPAAPGKSVNGLELVPVATSPYPPERSRSR